MGLHTFSDTTQVKDDRSVKISHKSNIRLTVWLSKVCNSDYFTA